jgi:hypothetical protein
MDWIISIAHLTILAASFCRIPYRHVMGGLNAQRDGSISGQYVERRSSTLAFVDLESKDTVTNAC